jgi:hypothetical protein
MGLGCLSGLCLLDKTPEVLILWPFLSIPAPWGHVPCGWSSRIFFRSLPFWCVFNLVFQNS